ncbi:MAG: hypothetical protein K0Q72_1870 [Armatimonadetes bacterium]|jgi:hypothetical protein|nr:hypothetical protein [Armatimonadota bacterium]
MNRITKKELAVGMYQKGMRVDSIAEVLGSDPSYVANVLIERGFTPEYVDLYTSTGPQNRYAAMLSGVLRFKDVAAARESVRKIDELHTQFEAQRDRRGMHQCELLALTGKNRAAGIGKWQEARVFGDWLSDHLYVARPEVIQLSIPELREDEAPPLGIAA